jgi:DNA-binding NtrC family response regulator
LKPLPELTAFLEGLPEPHILFDAQYRILAANAAYQRQFSPERSVIGRRCYEVSHHFAVPCDQAGESCPLAQSRLSGQRERVLHLHHTPQGEEYVNIELSPLAGEGGQPAFFVEKMEPLRVAQGQAKAHGLIGRSDAFQRMLALVARVAPARASVLLLGESGTGKELVARAIHEASPRAAKPLVAVDCSSLPENLFESELFGHERGAFTGAATARGGLVEAASGGTLFLDEVGDIPLPMQVKLLRLLETGTYRRVGGTELRHADIRVVSATHRDLHQLVAEGRFREDLLHRLSVFPIRLPALRERMDDLPLLIESLLGRVSPERHLSVSTQALAALMQHRFGGNIRELRNVLERLSLLCDGDVIEARHVDQALNTHGSASNPATTSWRAPPGSPAGQGTVQAISTLKEREQQALLDALSAHTGTRAELAARSGPAERSLYRRLKALGLS